MKKSKPEQHLDAARAAWNEAVATGTVEEQRAAKQRLTTARRKWRKARVTTGNVAQPKTLRVTKQKG